MNFITSKEEFLNVVMAWANIANRTAADHIIYNVLRGHDPKRGFVEIKNTGKISSGARPWQGFEAARFNVLWKFRENSPTRFDDAVRILRRKEEYDQRIASLNKQFGITFTPEIIAKIREILK